MPGSAPTVPAKDWELKVHEAAQRIALSPAFRNFFDTDASPEKWATWIRLWDEDTLNTALLLVQEEESMRRDVAVTAERKKNVNKTRLLQRIEKMRFDSSHS